MFYDNEQPHQGQPVLEKGKPLNKAKGAVILIHGRGATADSILTLTDELQRSGERYDQRFRKDQGQQVEDDQQFRKGKSGRQVDGDQQFGEDQGQQVEDDQRFRKDQGQQVEDDQQFRKGKSGQQVDGDQQFRKDQEQQAPGELPADPLSDLAWLAPQANYHTWYPYSFLAPIEQNEPGLTSALALITELIEKVTESGIPMEKIVLAGFSQGACLSCEYAARNPGRYGGVVALSGGVIGPDVDQQRYQGSMDGTPVFLGCSDYDHHIPEERVHESADLFGRLGADVTKKIYEGLGHTVNEDEFQHFLKILAKLI